jgi:calcium/calmodulin-dependent protein kinase I
MVKLANRIEALKMQEEDPENSDMPKDATLAADQTRHFASSSSASSSSAGANKGDSDSAAAAAGTGEGTDGEGGGEGGGKRKLSKTIKSAIFREVVLAKVREMKEQEETLKVAGEASKKA